MFALLSILWSGVSASADTLRCQSVNGNLNCAGSSGVSCQTVNGKKVCVSGHGDVVQSFGSGKSSHDDVQTDGQDMNDPALHQRLEQSGPHGRTLLLERDGARLHIHTDWLSLDRD
ncbi:MAG TPA: hypothetical protein VGM32_17300 [Rhodopila sp.]|jgi:hypothetical protein